MKTFISGATITSSQQRQLMIANVQTSMFSYDAWTPPMIRPVRAEQLVNCFRRSARWRQSSAGLLSSEPSEPSGLHQSPTVDAVELTPWPLELLTYLLTYLMSRLALQIAETD